MMPAHFLSGLYLLTGRNCPVEQRIKTRNPFPVSNWFYMLKKG
jgi:hypothetical protein